ncbi:hypothetical protein Tco_0825665, partial [Tanacetum coccineum]
SPDYTPDTPHSDEESEPIEASETKTASPLDSTSPLSPNHTLTQTSPTPTPSRAFYYCSIAHMAYETPSLSASPTSSLTHLIWKRYRGSSESILDAEIEDDELEAEGASSGSEESKDEGPGSKGEEDASEEEQQQAVKVEDTTADKPLGLGYRAARRCALELAKDPVPSTFEVGQRSRSVPNQQRADEMPRLPTRPTWVDREDGTVYIDIEFDAPPVRAPIQTPTSPEWSFGSLLVYPASLTIPSPVASPLTTPATTLTVYEDEFIEVGAQFELQGAYFKTTPNVYTHCHLHFLRVWVGILQSYMIVLALEAWAGWTDAQRAALCQARYEYQREIHALRMQHVTDQREMQRLRERVDTLERRMDGFER